MFTQIVQMALNGARNRYINVKSKKYSVSSVSTVFDTLHYTELYKLYRFACTPFCCLHLHSVIERCDKVSFLP